MPVEIGGVMYYSTADIIAVIDVSRQTLWRWRLDGKVPEGCRYRDGSVLFTDTEYQAMCAYAHRLAPADLGAPRQSEPFT